MLKKISLMLVMIFTLSIFMGCGKKDRTNDFEGTIPEDYKILEWKWDGVGALLPEPELLIGERVVYRSNRIYLYMLTESRVDYETYVTECKKEGFTVDFVEGEDYYKANDKNGNHLVLTYSEKDNYFTCSLNTPEDK